MEFGNNETIDFGTLEKLAYKLATRIVRQSLKEILEAMDEYLMLVRDASRFEVKEIQEREIETMVGTVRFRRRYYLDRKLGRWMYLLDEKLKLKNYQRVGPGLTEVATTLAVTGPSYRHARDRIEELMGERMISHEGIRQLVGKTSELIEADETEPVKKRRVEVLFVEADGIWTGRQGKRKKQETKLCVVHEGWQERYRGSQEYELRNKRRYVRHEGNRRFWEGLRQQLERDYEALDDTMVVINGDGSPWIRAGLEYFSKSIYQYDRFHITRDIRKALRSYPDLMDEALKALKANQIGELVEALRQGLGRASGKERRSLRAVLKTVAANWESIIDYRLRLGALGYDCGTMRGLGSIESNVGKLKNRIGRGRSWSTGGLQALTNVLFKFLDGTLYRYTSRIMTKLSESVERFVDSGAKIVKRVVLGNEPGVKHGHLPCLDRGTRGYAKAFRQLLHEGYPF